MRQHTALGIVLLAAVALLAGGCSTDRPGGKVVTPTPSKVVGKVSNPKANIPKGDATAGKAVFVNNGCGACHVFKAAAAAGSVGPDLDKLAQYATTANQGTTEAFTRQSITDPGAYVEKGYAAGIMPAFSTLSAQQLSDLVAFLTQGS